MVEVLIGNESMVLTSKKTIDKDLVKALKNKDFNKQYDKRIAAWMKDYNTTYDLNHGTLEFSRKYSEEDINPNGLESTIAKLESDHSGFIYFLSDLMKEYNQQHDPEDGHTAQQEINEEKQPEDETEEKALLILMRGKEVCVCGEIHPLIALDILLETVIKYMLDERNKDQ